MKKLKSNESSIIKSLMESDLSGAIYRCFFNKLILLDLKISKDLLENEIKNFIMRNKLIEKAKHIVDNFMSHKNIKHDYNDELEEKLCKYIGQIYLIYEMQISNEEILNIIMELISESNIYDICLKMQDNSYKGYYDYMKNKGC